MVLFLFISFAGFAASASDLSMFAEGLATEQLEVDGTLRKLMEEYKSLEQKQGETMEEFQLLHRSAPNLSQSRQSGCSKKEVALHSTRMSLVIVSYLLSQINPPGHYNSDIYYWMRVVDDIRRQGFMAVNILEYTVKQFGSDLNPTLLVAIKNEIKSMKGSMGGEAVYTEVSDLKARVENIRSALNRGGDNLKFILNSL